MGSGRVRPDPDERRKPLGLRALLPLGRLARPPFPAARGLLGPVPAPAGFRGLFTEELSGHVRLLLCKTKGLFCTITY